MLAQIAAIYVHLGRADADGAFARAIVDDERSYRRDMFPEAAQVPACVGDVMLPASPHPRALSLCHNQGRSEQWFVICRGQAGTMCAPVEWVSRGLLLLGPKIAHACAQKECSQGALGAGAQVLRAHMLLPEGEVRELEALAGRVQGADAEKAAEDDALGDPPPEFLDALMDTLMAEPVILPKSRAVVDRSTINRCARAICVC